MKIITIEDEIEDTQIVPLDWTYRYMGAQHREGFRRVGSLAQQGFIRQNICGFGDSTSKANCVRFEFTPNILRPVTKLAVNLRRKYVNHTNYVFRWAVTWLTDDSRFTGYNEPQSEFLITSGKFNAHKMPIYMPVSGLESGEKYYIYLTPSNHRYGNFHIVGDVVIDIYTQTGQKVWRDATPYIWKNGSWKQATPYIHKSGQWTES